VVRYTKVDFSEIPSLFLIKDQIIASDDGIHIIRDSPGDSPYSNEPLSIFRGALLSGSLILYDTIYVDSEGGSVLKEKVQRSKKEQKINTL